MNRRYALSLLAASLLAACTPDASTTGEGPSDNKKGTIGVSVLTLGNPFFKIIGDTITAEAAKHGYDTIVVSGDDDVAKQQNQVKDFIVKGVAAIVLSPCDSKAIGPVIEEANAAGVPVFTIDIACQAPGAEVVAHVATDNLGGGRLAAEAMIKALGDAGGEVAILDYKEVESCILRVKGFKEVIAKHNESATNPIRIVTELPCQGSKDHGYTAAQDALEAHAGLDGIFAINDPSALGARAALEKAGRTESVVLIGFDGMPEGKQAIKEGKIYADPIQFPDRMAKKTVEAIVDHFRGEEVEKEILIPAELYFRADAEKDPSLE